MHDWGHLRRTTSFLNFFIFWPFLKFFTNMPLEVFFQNLDPYLDAIVGGAELTRLGAKGFGA